MMKMVTATNDDNYDRGGKDGDHHSLDNCGGSGEDDDGNSDRRRQQQWWRQRSQSPQRPMTMTAVVVTGAMAADTYINHLMAAAEEMAEAGMAMAVAMAMAAATVTEPTI